MSQIKSDEKFKFLVGDKLTDLCESLLGEKTSPRVLLLIREALQDYAYAILLDVSLEVKPEYKSEFLKVLDGYQSAYLKDMEKIREVVWRANE